MKQVTLILIATMLALATTPVSAEPEDKIDQITYEGEVIGFGDGPVAGLGPDVSPTPDIITVSAKETNWANCGNDITTIEVVFGGATLDGSATIVKRGSQVSSAGAWAYLGYPYSGTATFSFLEDQGVTFPAGSSEASAKVGNLFFGVTGEAPFGGQDMSFGGSGPGEQSKAKTNCSQMPDVDVIIGIAVGTVENAGDNCSDMPPGAPRLACNLALN
jgi:hypothetical protein